MSTSLKAAQLNIPLQATDLGFINTSSLNVEDSFAWIGQTDAAQAANFGLSLFEPGFNMLVLGESGSGRKSLTLKAIQAASSYRAKPYDLVLLYHFDAPEKPLQLYLNAGHGVRLRHEMDTFIRQMMKSIPAMIAQTAIKDKAKSEKEPKVESEDKKTAEELKLSLDAFFAQQFARLMMIVKGDASPLALAELVKFDLYLAALLQGRCPRGLPPFHV